MSFSVDQFMQVKCKFQLTSETESSESIHYNNERIRLCASVDMDKNHSTLIVMVCSNETSNNHIVAYYIERRIQTTVISSSDVNHEEINKQPDNNNSSSASPKLNATSIASMLLASITNQPNQPNQPIPPLTSVITRIKPRTIVKQIYYHTYNEDIVAICLDRLGNKLVLVNASSTIYIIPIKNIMLNLHSKQLSSSQGKSMYFYDASILNCCTLDNPVSVAFWNSLENEDKSTVIVADESNHISFISVEEKKEVYVTQIGEPIKTMDIIRDRFSHSLLITCFSYKQYRFALELIKQQSTTDLDPSNYQDQIYSDEFSHLENDVMPSFDRKPTLIRLNGSHNLFNSGGGSPISVIHRVINPFMRPSNESQPKNPSAASIVRERSLPLIFYLSNDVVGVIDVLGTHKAHASTNNRVQNPEPRLLRFFSSKQFYYRPQKPLFVCKLTILDSNEMITHLVVTDRFIAVATDRDRCLINSRNCCNLRSSNSSVEVNPIIKEIKFGNDEKILLLIKSPVTNDQDEMIDSFILATSRSIYSIEARQTCRNMFINLIDSHLGIKTHRSRTRTLSQSLAAMRHSSHECNLIDGSSPTRKDSDSILLICNFLSQRDEVYERISYDSRAFSILFKIELNSLYEAYGDKLLIRGQFNLAHRFFQMAKFDYKKILGKYIRLGALKLTDQYEMSLKMFTPQQKEIIDSMFIQFLSACLDESMEDSCRLWYNYVNFYLNCVGPIEELESNILSFFDSNSNDCRLVTTLYIAIGKDEQERGTKESSSWDCDGSLKDMENLYRLSEVFSNEFLMKLLERALDMIPHSSDLNALSDCCWYFWQ